MASKANQKEKEEVFDIAKKVTVRSIAGWTTGFARIADGYGDVTITPNGSVLISRNEILAQCQNGNALLLGTDNLGSHATLYVDDKDTRVQLGFEGEDGTVTQKVFTDEKIKSIFEIKSQNKFEESLRDAIVTRAEKKSLINAIQRLNINDFSRIRFAENLTGYKVQ